jgi:SWI/SNF-related matrix-associated actin-dependent regulator 1 of chromatin subfamily A
LKILFLGLGKTAQVIAFLAHLKEVKEPGPHLIIVPSSTLDNWIREFATFAPSLKVASYYGSQAERHDLRHELKASRDLDAVVTTYNMATGSPDDRKFFRKMEFKACVFDEGHQLKNSQSKKYRDLMEIRVEWRLLLTGTPLQNNLQELVVSFLVSSLLSISAVLISATRSLCLASYYRRSLVGVRTVFVPFSRSQLMLRATS